MQTEYTIYGIHNCQWCDRAKSLLTEKNLSYKFLYIGEDISRVDFKEKIMGVDVETRVTAPQIFHPNGKHIGGFTDLEKILR